MGGRGSSGGKRSSGGSGMSPEQSRAKQLILNAKFDSVDNYNTGKERFDKIVDPNFTGKVMLSELGGASRSFKDFYKFSEVTKEDLIDAVKAVHPNKKISVTRDVYKRDKYARGGTSSGSTRFYINIE